MDTGPMKDNIFGSEAFILLTKMEMHALPAQRISKFPSKFGSWCTWCPTPERYPGQARSQWGGGGVGLPPPPSCPSLRFCSTLLAWGPIKVTIPSSYRWKYAPLWLINHPRRLELDSLFLPWYRQPNHTLYIAVADPGGGGGGPGMITPPPLELVPILKTYAKLG